MTQARAVHAAAQCRQLGASGHSCGLVPPTLRLIPLHPLPPSSSAHHHCHSWGSLLCCSTTAAWLRASRHVYRQVRSATACPAPPSRRAALSRAPCASLPLSPPAPPRLPIPPTHANSPRTAAERLRLQRVQLAGGASDPDALTTAWDVYAAWLASAGTLPPPPPLLHRVHVAAAGCAAAAAAVAAAMPQHSRPAPPARALSRAALARAQRASTCSWCWCWIPPPLWSRTTPSRSSRRALCTLCTLCRACWWEGEARRSPAPRAPASTLAHANPA